MPFKFCPFPLQLRTEGLNVSYEQSSIYLPPDAFNAQNSRVVTVVYLTLNDVLPLAKDNAADGPISPNTTVVSSTVVPRSSGNFDFPKQKGIGINFVAFSFNNCVSDFKDSRKLTKLNFILVALCSEIPERGNGENKKREIENRKVCGYKIRTFDVDEMHISSV